MLAMPHDRGVLTASTRALPTLRSSRDAPAASLLSKQHPSCLLIAGLGCSPGSFFASEMKERPHAEEIDEHRDDVPGNYRTRSNQQPGVDPEDLKHAHNACHPGVHACARSAPEHRQQSRQSGKGGSEARHKAENLRLGQTGNEQALRVTRHKTFATVQREHSQDENTQGTLVET